MCEYASVCVSSRGAGPVSACGQRAGDEVASHGGRRAVSVSAGWRLQGLWWDKETMCYIRTNNTQQHGTSLCWFYSSTSAPQGNDVKQNHK